MSDEPRVKFQEEDNVEIEYEEEAIDDDQESYQQFNNLTDGVVNCLSLMQTEMDNYLYFKDELMQQMLPPNLLLQLSLVSGRLYRSYSDLQIPLWELLRLVRVYSSPWEEKRAALQKMHDDYSRKKSQLEVALRRLTTQDADVRRAARDRRVMNWERLFARVQLARGHGRRWKFRMYDFKQKAALGVEHLAEYFADEADEVQESQEPEEEQGEQEAEEADPDAERAEEEDAKEEEEAASVTAAKEAAEAEFPDIQLEAFSDVEENAEPDAGEVLEREQTDLASLSLPTDVVAVETADAAAWTHEPEFVEFLHVRVHAAKNVKAKQVTVQLRLGSSSRWRRLEAQDVTQRAVDERRRMRRAPQAAAGDDDAGESATYETISFRMPTDFRQLQQLQLEACVLDERMDTVGNVVIDIEEIRRRHLPVVDVERNEGEGEGEGEEGKEEEEFKEPSLTEDVKRQLTPEEFDLKPDADSVAGQLPMAMFWSRYAVHWVYNKDINTASVYDLVQDLTGIDLHKVTKEELNREKVDACMSPRPLTPQADGVPQEELDKLNDEFTDRMQQLEQEYIDKLKDLESRLQAAQTDNQQPQQQQQTKETMDRATSAQKSLPGSRRSSGRLRSPQQQKQDAEQQQQQQQQQQEPVKQQRQQKAAIRKDTRPKKNFMVGRPLPAWGESLPDDFFERMELMQHLTKEHKEELVGRIRAEIARQVEAQLHELSRISYHAAAAAAAAQSELRTNHNRAGAEGEDTLEEEEEEVTIPALFMPQRGEHKVYNARAHQYFQPTGMKGLRLTQPPSMLSLPPLPNKPSVLNLFNLGVRASYPQSSASAAAAAVAPDDAAFVQTQLNLLRRAAS